MDKVFGEFINHISSNGIKVSALRSQSGMRKRRRQQELISACTCSASCGSNYSMNGGCVCSTSCGSNYSR